MALVLFLLTALGIILLIGIYAYLILKINDLTYDKEFLALKRPESLEDFPKISVIVPARNEQRNIKRCINSILNFDYPNFEIIVVDDFSSDKTTDIVNEIAKNQSKIKITLLNSINFDLKERKNWTSGKGFVLWNASTFASGEWLLFIDADTKQKNDGLWRSVLFTLNNKLKVFSGSGIYFNPKFWGDVFESIIYTAVFISIPLKKVNNPKEKVGWLNGQFILFEKETYFNVNGHKAIKEFITDDLAMANYLKKQNVEYKFLTMAELYNCTNYVGLREAVNAWVRLIAMGTSWIGIKKLYLINSIITIFLTSVLPFLIFPFSITNKISYNFLFLNLNTLVKIQIILAIFLLALNRSAMKIPIWRSIFLPIGSIFTIFVYMKSFYQRFIKKTISWKNRSLKVDDIS